jgi:hypothetical protein
MVSEKMQPQAHSVVIDFKAAAHEREEAPAWYTRRHSALCCFHI